MLKAPGNCYINYKEEKYIALFTIMADRDSKWGNVIKKPINTGFYELDK